MTSQWAWWRPRSPASRLFTQPFIQAQIQENIKAPRHRVRGIHRWPVNSPHKGPVTRKIFPFDDVIMCCWLIAVTRFAKFGGVGVKHVCVQTKQIIISLNNGLSSVRRQTFTRPLLTCRALPNTFCPCTYQVEQLGGTCGSRMHVPGLCTKGLDSRWYK